MRKHISTFVLILVIAGLITALFYTGKSLIRKNTEVAVLNQQNEDLNKSIEELNKKIEDLQDEKIDKDTSKEEKNEEVNNSIVIPVLNLDKIVNKEEGTTIEESVYANNGVISVSADNESKSLNVSLDAGLARQIYGYNGQSENHTIAALSEEIVDVKILNSGKGSDSVKIVILTESGKVKYIDIANILDKSYTIKSVDNIENVIRITGVSIETTENSDISYGVIGIKADGTAEIINF